MDFVLLHPALSRLPAHIQGGHGGVQHLQVPDSAQRLCGGTNTSLYQLISAPERYISSGCLKDLKTKAFFFFIVVVLCLVPHWFVRRW